MDEFLQKLHEGRLSTGDSMTPLHREYDGPEINRGEIFRYAGIPAAVIRERSLGTKDDAWLKALSEKCAKCGKGCSMSAAGVADTWSPATKCSEPEDEELNKLLDEAILLMQGKLTYRVSYVCVKIDRAADGYPILPFKQHSDGLKKNLENCSGAIIFAATIGSGIDMLIRRYERTAPAKGLIFQGMGAERVEALCDLFNDEVIAAAQKAGVKAHPRFSPGYGDLPIEVQPGVLELVDAQRRLGITLNESFLMSPSKSVTAIIGLENLQTYECT